MKTPTILKRLSDQLLGTRAALLYILSFAIAIAVATFVENDYGTDSAQKVIYKSWWFELLLLLFAASLLKNVIDFRMWQRGLWSVMLFHLSIIIIILGAGITRYAGFEGMMRIRENSSSNQFLSSEAYLKMRFEKGGQSFLSEQPVLWSSLGTNHFEESFQLGNDLVEVSLKECIVNPVYSLKEDPDGSPIIKIVFGSANGREEHYLEYAHSKMINGVPFYFGPGSREGFFSIQLQEPGALPLVQSSRAYSFTRMASQEKFEVAADSTVAIALRSLYQWGEAAFVFGDYTEKGLLERNPGELKLQSSSTIGLDFELVYKGEIERLYIEGYKGSSGKFETVNFEDLNVSIAYGSKLRTLPFALKLYDFEMTRYPGTNSPASFASEVALVDAEKGVNYDYRIYMNHILNYRGYRFFQSSYDRDEKGTYLSVNHDQWGSWVSYLGYALLTLGMIASLIVRNTRFALLAEQIKKIRAKRAVGIFILAVSVLPLSAQTTLEAQLPMVSQSHAERFSEILVQDIRGRMKPMHTLSREVLRKLLGKETYRGYTADQVILSVWADSPTWYAEALIKLPYHPRFEELGFAERVQPYKAFFNKDGSYKLADLVREANAVIDKEKGTWEKALLKLDEKINIFNMMLSGYLLRIVPLEGDANNTWVSNHGHGQQSSIVADKLFPAYAEALRRGMADGDFSLADEIVGELSKYQEAQDDELLPSAGQRSLEIQLNKLKVFNRLALIYTLLGIAFLFSLFLQVFRPQRSFEKLHRVLLILMLLAFAFHTLGLGLRWYVSGRAPWSNGYESMIYIAWTGALAGILFSRKSSGALAATNVLSGVVLLIALLSYLNPEITPLVPVLRSYWLTIHVSLEAGSYGFLMLGAIIGVINLLLMIFLSPKNQIRIQDMVSEMSKLSEMTITGGLFMLSVGTYLGGVWANESWGRYWGWDAKETWALVSILVYAFILHMRFIPAFRGHWAFNFGSLFGLASIIMTYYGVNYYLSGLHSYAAGDPVPIPAWVYWSIASLAVISLLAYWRQRKVWKSTQRT